MTKSDHARLRLISAVSTNYGYALLGGGVLSGTWDRFGTDEAWQPALVVFLGMVCHLFSLYIVPYGEP